MRDTSRAAGRGAVDALALDERSETAGRHRPGGARPWWRRWWAYAAAAATATALVLGAVTMLGSTSAGRPSVAAQPLASSAPAPAKAVASPATTPARVGVIPPLPGPQGPAHSVAPVRASAPPIRLIVPSIGVDTTLESLRLLPDGSLAAPSQWGLAGWYSAGVRPGDAGPAVIAGHVDSVNGPAVFFRLRQLRPGAEAFVRASTGVTLRFVVDSAASYPKAHFPTAAVYGPTPLPELRLITCTGDFDFQARSYLDNLVVSAHLS